MRLSCLAREHVAKMQVAATMSIVGSTKRMWLDMTEWQRFLV
jgi:hypothetical protein